MKISAGLSLTWQIIYFYTCLVFKIAVVDGQGGGIGSLIVKRLRDEFGDKIEILVLGTNAAATSAMMKSRANKGATGENAIIRNAGRVNTIIGPLSIVLPNAMLGEMTPEMADAILSSEVKKILLPLNQEGIDVIGVEKEPLPHMIEKIITSVRHEIGKEK
jgi:NAD(P)-dependent dehydrogenase (short-subunit alcohol dehydrogenase family)